MTSPTPINRLLIANRGEIARRIIRTAHDMGVSTVAVYADGDREAPYVAEADLAVPLGGSSASDTYLSVDKIVRAAQHTGSQAIHPGYGFLSESAALADACRDAGLIFVGPSAEALRSMGLKDVAKSMARQAGLPTLPDALLDDPTAWASAATDVGFPLLVKATAGGGGKGMRLVERPEDLDAAVTTARREAGSSFGNTAVFIERYLARARHIEVQVFGDHHGNALHLFERECSLQRRHQKVIEEAPAPTMTPDLRTRMTDASTSLVRRMGYVGAGTIEYLVNDDADGEPTFYFLEMNTRLQVEHPVTEMVTGLDLVRLQLKVAAGLPLTIEQDAIRLRGHAIEARLCAEDPAHDYRPTPGTMHRYRPAPTPDVRYEDALAGHGEISPRFDPMIAKVIAWGPGRAEAAARLARSIAGMHTHGVTTNRDQVVAILRDEDFLAGRTWTGMLEARPDLAAPADVDVVLHLAAATVASVQARTAADLHDIDPGWRGLAHSPLSKQTWRGATGGEIVDTRYRVRRTGASSGSVTLKVDEHEHTFDFRMAADDVVELLADGLLHTCEVAGHPDGSWWVNTVDQQSGWYPEPRLGTGSRDQGPAGASLPVPGTVVVIDVAPGDRVEEGQRLLVVEAMKDGASAARPLRRRRGGRARPRRGRRLPALGAGHVQGGELSTPIRPLRVANCSGFYGDRLSAAREMVTGGPIDVLTGDWLAELTMGILHRQRSRNPMCGFATTFLTQMEQVLGTCSERGIRVVSNAGGANPAACAASVREIVDRLGLSLSVAVVDGDDVTEQVSGLLASGAPATHMVTGRPFAELGGELLAANAYLGAWGIAEALDAGADIVVTGRVTDASVVVAPAAHHFGWRRDSWDELAGAVVAGHIIECGGQATGGNLSFFQEVPDLRRPGFPLAEIHHEGSSVITKHDGTGGAVTVDTVTAQLLYEVDGPRYHNPDVVARLDTVRLEQLDSDRVLVSRVRGEPAPDTIKVGMLAAPGWRNTVLLGLAGRHIAQKAKLAVDAIGDAVPGGMAAFDDVRVELIGTENAEPSSMPGSACVLAVSVADADRARADRFSRAVVETGLASYPGFFLLSPPTKASQYTVFWPTLMPAGSARQRVHLDGRTWHPEPAARPTAHRGLAEPLEWGPRRAPARQGPTAPRALGEFLGARSGDKAGNATLGLWARSHAAHRWLMESFDVEALRALVPEFGDIELRPWALPNLRAVGVTAVGYLGHGVGANLTLDPQAKSLGEYVLTHQVDIPEALLNELEDRL